VPAWADHLADLGQVQVHRPGVAEWQDQCGAPAVRGADGAEDAGRGVALVLGAEGLLPRFAQRPVMLFLWPILLIASGAQPSANQISTVSRPRPCSRATPASVAGKFFLNVPMAPIAWA